MTILFGDGAGAFPSQEAHAVEEAPVSLTAGRFNAGAALDIAVLSESGAGLDELDDEVGSVTILLDPGI